MRRAPCWQMAASQRVTRGALLGCADPAMIDTLAKRVPNQGLSVRQTEEARASAE